MSTNYGLHVVRIRRNEMTENIQKKLENRIRQKELTNIEKIVEYLKEEIRGRSMIMI
jgi:hypothetical protein